MYDGRYDSLSGVTSHNQSPSSPRKQLYWLTSLEVAASHIYVYRQASSGCSYYYRSAGGSQVMQHNEQESLHLEQGQDFHPGGCHSRLV